MHIDRHVAQVLHCVAAQYSVMTTASAGAIGAQAHFLDVDQKMNIMLPILNVRRGEAMSRVMSC